MQPYVNLIPAYRLEAHRHRQHVRQWVIRVCVYAAGALGVCVLAHVTWDTGHPNLEPQIRRTQAQIKTLNGSIASANTTLARTRRSLQANQQLRDHPDWSLLLAYLAKAIDAELVLRECTLEPHQIQAATNQPVTDRQPSNPIPPRAYQINLRGLGRSQAAVSRFVLRLEQTGLFDQVKLVDTSLEPFLSNKAIGFRVTCGLGTDRAEADTP